ncbi:hypothetical protein ANO11243_095830 [Dothideomycetidae sp. 11243]|nr:hypothetical protein ANO11243_095830 [fungal sp. No.11243]
MTARRSSSFWARAQESFFFHGRDHDTPDVDLSPAEADSLVRYQLTRAQPQYLTSDSFVYSGITGNETLSTVRPKTDAVSERVYSHLKQMGIVNEPPSLPVDTTKINKHFTNTLYFISMRTQKRLVGMLFFWEEECTRLRLLDEEEAEIAGLLKQDPSSKELEIHLQSVKMKKLLLPSQRAEKTHNHLRTVQVSCETAVIKGIFSRSDRYSVFPYKIQHVVSEKGTIA